MFNDTLVVGVKKKVYAPLSPLYLNIVIYTSKMMLLVVINSLRKYNRVILSFI